jgi:hypothetical protein
LDKVGLRGEAISRSRFPSPVVSENIDKATIIFPLALGMT